MQVYYATKVQHHDASTESRQLHLHTGWKVTFLVITSSFEVPLLWQTQKGAQCLITTAINQGPRLGAIGHDAAPSLESQLSYNH